MGEAKIQQNYKELLSKVDTQLDGSQTSSELEALGFFDLSGSTSMKIKEGHMLGTKNALRFISAASEVVKDAGGIVVKELGDGILCRFKNPVDACIAAINVQYLTDELGVDAACGLTVGQFSTYIRPSGKEDVFGHAIDRCARIQSLASPRQVLIDDAMFNVVRTHLEDVGIKVGRSFKGYGKRYWRNCNMGNFY